MSFYTKRVNNKYAITHHALKRVRDRFKEHKDSSDFDIILFIETAIEDAVLENHILTDGEFFLINYDLKIKMIITKENVIKTVLRN